MINTLQWFVRIAGLGALVLGAMLWFAPETALKITRSFATGIEVHMVLGGIVALALAVLAAWALIDRVRIPAALAGLLWAIATVIVGTLQDWWVAGGSHPVMAVIHLLLGIGAIGLAEMLAATLKKAKLAGRQASLP
jgi:hypothetical protein